jgi:hypothetical protein
VRWQSIEILLGPEEHVPFIQNAVRTFNIKHPDTGVEFPTELPKEAFPLVPDVAIEKWHSDCAAKLRERATPAMDDASMRPDLPPRPKVQTGYAHVRASRPMRGDSEYFEDSRSRPPTRPIPYSHVPVAGGVRPVRPKMSRSPTYRARQFLAPEEPMAQRIHRSRRRSLPENVSPISPTTVPVDIPTRSPEDPRVRGHSHPRHARRGSVSSDASSERESPIEHMAQAANRQRHHSHPIPYQARAEEEINAARHAPSVPTPPDPRRRVGRSGERRNREEEDKKRRSQPIPIDLSGKLSAPFMLGKREKERDRARDRDAEKVDKYPRSTSGNAHKVSWKDLGDGPDFWRRSSKDSSQDESHSRHRSERSDDRLDYKTRDREKHSDRESYRERDKERERAARHHSRRNSQEELPVRPRTRERDHERERERDVERGGRSASDRRALRDRDRHSPVRGVDGRRYPSHT